MQINLKPLFKLATAKPAITAAVVAVILAAGGFTTWLHVHDTRIRDGVHLADSLAVLRVTAKRLDSVRLLTDTVVVHDSVRVTRTLARLDTLWRDVPDTLRTHTDTVRALVALPIIRQQSDSVKRACTEQTVSCAAYRVTADSVIRVLRAQLVIVPKIDATKPPSKWATVERWTERIAIACGAYSLGAHHACWQR